MCLGIPGLVLEVTDTEKKLGVVDVGGVKRTVNLACIVDEEHPIEACAGAWVLVHVGFAMQRVDEEEAARTLELLRELGEIQAQMDNDAANVPVRDSRGEVAT
ncbi:MAG: HypC/HybG/HupF family hydrogenase formation chaperone [Polyangiaceae bacterium]